MSDEYSDIHRAFLQTISHVGLLNTKQALKMLIGIYGKYHKGETIPNDDHLHQVVMQINEKIRPYDQRISLMTYPLNEMDFYVFYNEHASPMSKHQNIFTEDEVYFFRLVLGELATKGDHKLKTIECLNMIVKLQGKGMTKLRAEKLLERFQKRGYLYRDEHYWYFGPRTIIEFDGFLATKFPDSMENCSLCKNNVYWGVGCSDCNKQFHKDCIKKYLKKTTKCPNCKELWSTSLE